ncbi:uncharacterized protein METZ01_LOCUS366149, partial [marine metagenome]
ISYLIPSLKTVSSHSTSGGGEQELRRTRQRIVRSFFMSLVITKRGFFYKDPHVELTPQLLIWSLLLGI